MNERQEERQIREIVREQHVQEQEVQQNQVMHANLQQAAHGAAARPDNIQEDLAAFVEENLEIEAFEEEEEQEQVQEQAQEQVQEQAQEQVREQVQEQAQEEVREQVQEHAQAQARTDLKGIEQFVKMLTKSDVSGRQALRMLRVFLKVWKSDGGEDQEGNHLFELQMQEMQHYYDVEKERLREEDPMHEIRRKLGQPEEPEQPDETGFPAERIALLQEADKWLMDAYLKKNKNLDQTIVFSILERPARERMLVYYMMEHGYQTAMRPSFIPLSQMNYKPDLSKLANQKVQFSKLPEIYQQVCAVRDTIQLWNEAAQQQEADKEDLEGRKRAMEGNEQILALLEQRRERMLQGEIELSREERFELNDQIAQIRERIKKQTPGVTSGIQALRGMEELENLAETYKKYRKRTNLSKKKRRLEEQMRAKVVELGTNVATLLANRRAVAEQGQQEFEDLKHTNEQVKEEGLNKKLVAGAFVGTGITGIAAGKMVESKLAEKYAAAAQMLEELAKSKMDDQLGIEAASWTAQALQAAENANILGVVSSVLGLTLGVVQGSTALAKEYASMDRLSVAEKSLDIAKKGLTSGKKVGAAAVKLTSGTEAATVGLAAAGITVGVVSASAGVYKVVHAGIEKRRGKQAAADLRNLENQENREVEIRENITKIQERITKRKQVTAGCQVISGICTTAAGACTITGNAAGATLFGLVGGLATGAGMLITVFKKKKDSRAAVDEFLGLENLAQQQETELLRRKKKLSGSEKRGIRNRLRQELTERLGFGSEKALHSFIMHHYAEYIYGKIQPLLDDPVRALADADSEERAYLEFVGSLGLDIRKKHDAAEEENRKPGLPTTEMIYQKLMS